jgi:two-component sensor histidine kinase
LTSGDILNFTTEHGLPGLEVRSLTLDEAHFLWIGGATGWVSSIDLGAETYEFRNITLEDPLPPLFTVQADKNQNLWMGTSKGVYRWKFDANRLPLVTEHFGRAEGFEGIEVCTNAVVACDNGSVWFGTVAGVSVSNPSSEDVTLKPPVVYIDQPHLFYRSFSELPLRHYINKWSEPADTLVLTMDQNHLSFSLHAINLQLPEDILYSHFLEGMEDTWSPFDENTTVSYSNLPPGTYTLRVRACVRGQACAEARPVNIRILAPFWQKTWFILCALIGGLLVLVTAFVFAVKRVKQRAKEKNERLRLERDVIDLEQKALRLQMNPHFIFNTLNSIQGLIAQQDNKTARLYLARFSRLMREILENSREDAITFEEEFETLRTYVELHKFTLNVQVELDIDCDDELLDHPLPPLLLQPFVENAILHGIVPQGEGRISIRAAVRENQVEITIEDNGIGRAASAANKPFSHKSAGLEVTRSRLSLLHASDNEEFFTVSDVIPHGTRVSILLPLVRG